MEKKATATKKATAKSSSKKSTKENKNMENITATEIIAEVKENAEMENNEIIATAEEIKKEVIAETKPEVKEEQKKEVKAPKLTLAERWTSRGYEIKATGTANASDWKATANDIESKVAEAWKSIGADDAFIHRSHLADDSIVYDVWVKLTAKVEVSKFTPEGSPIAEEAPKAEKKPEKKSPKEKKPAQKKAPKAKKTEAPAVATEAVTEAPAEVVNQ